MIRPLVFSLLILTTLVFSVGCSDTTTAQFGNVDGGKTLIDEDGNRWVAIPTTETVPGGSDANDLDAKPGLFFLYPVDNETTDED